MGKIRTYEDLESRINQNSKDRKKEIVSLKGICKSHKNNAYEQKSLLKSLVVISYSHFEGFVRDATKLYFEFLNTISLKSDKVNSTLLASYIQYLYNSNTRSKSRLIDSVKELLEDSVTLSFRSEFFSDTESNLKYDVLEKMLIRSGFNGNSFINEKVFIDDVILKNRNTYAHGDSLNEEVDELKSYNIADKIIDYINDYSTIILNAVAQHHYEKNNGICK